MSTTRRILAIGIVVVGLLASTTPVATATHADDVYDEFILFAWDTTELDVLIVPPAHGNVVPYCYATDAVNGVTDAYYEHGDLGCRLFDPTCEQAIEGFNGRLYGDLPCPPEDGATLNELVQHAVGTAADADEAASQSASEAGPGNSHARAVKDSIAAWEIGIRSMASGPLADELEIRPYVLGEDVPPKEALADPEIVVHTDGRTQPGFIAGLGLPSDYLCRQYARTIGSLANETVAEVVETRVCDEIGRVCTVWNWDLANADSDRDPTYMYNLNAHEFGHCLGLGHTGDGSDPDTYHPHGDIMSYEDQVGVRNCPSTLNMKGLEGIFAGPLGEPGGVGFGDSVSLPVEDYAQMDCSNVHAHDGP